MPKLPARPDLDQLRRQAKDLQRSASQGDPAAVRRISAVSGTGQLASAQLAVARHYGFPSWLKLKLEVERRALLNRCDVGGLARLIAENPGLAGSDFERWQDHPRGMAPLNYVSTLRFEHRRLGLSPQLTGTGAVAAALLRAGAPVEGRPGAPETPLITAASYGDAEVARVLIGAGADLEARATPDAGGVPGGTALLHAAVFGMTEVLDVIAAAGARVPSVIEAAAVGDLAGWRVGSASPEERIRALVMAADHQRLAVIDVLLRAGTPIDAADDTWHRQPLRLAAAHGRPASVRLLLDRGADPGLRDAAGRTALDLCRSDRDPLRPSDYDMTEAMLRAVAPPG